jgi:hypothetical protein
MKWTDFSHRCERATIRTSKDDDGWAVEASGMRRRVQLLFKLLLQGYRRTLYRCPICVLDVWVGIMKDRVQIGRNANLHQI